jgi:hypothetical protein
VFCLEPVPDRLKKSKAYIANEKDQKYFAQQEIKDIYKE